MFMVWSETAKLGPSSTSGGGSPHRVWLRGPAAFPQDKLAFGLHSEDPPPETTKSPCQIGLFVPVAQGSLCVLETASSAKNNHRGISPVCKGPATTPAWRPMPSRRLARLLGEAYHPSRAEGQLRCAARPGHSAPSTPASASAAPTQVNTFHKPRFAAAVCASATFRASFSTSCRSITPS